MLTDRAWKLNRDFVSKVDDPSCLPNTEHTPTVTPDHREPATSSGGWSSVFPLGSKPFPSVSAPANGEKGIVTFSRSASTTPDL